MKKKTPLHYAAEDISKKISGMTITQYRSKKVTIKLRRKQISIHSPEEESSKQLIELLISKGADINAKDIIEQNIIIVFYIKIIYYY